MQRGKKNKPFVGKPENTDIAQKALGIRAEMISVFEDLKHDPQNNELLTRFHTKCKEFSNLLNKVNQQYENTHKDLGLFKTKN